MANIPAPGKTDSWNEGSVTPSGDPLLHRIRRLLIQPELLKKILANVILAAMTSAILLGIDFANRMYHSLPHYSLYHPLHHHPFLYKLLFMMNFSLSLLLKNRHFLIIWGTILTLFFIQLLYFGYFGTALAATDISLFFTHKLEIVQAFRGLGQIIWVPIAICSLAFILIFITNKLLNNRQRWRYAWVIYLIILLSPIHQIYKAVYYPPKPHFDPNVSFGNYPSIHDQLWISTQKTLLYYFIYTLPHQFFFKNNQLLQAVLPPPVIETTSKNLNIILVMGESMTSNHMSSYHYSRKTTPFLDAIKNNPQAVFKSGISGGVCTDISLSMFFNGVLRPDGTMQIASTHWNLFKMAKNNGFKTYFISAQGRYNLDIIRNYLFPTFIDHLVDASEFGASFKESVLDTKLLEYLHHEDFNKPMFMVLHQRGSHFPYFTRYPQEFNLYHHPESDFKQQQIDAYDNSILYTDFFLASLTQLIIQKTSTPTVLIITSDHGESVGENNIFGHNHLKQTEQFNVPIIFIGLNGANLDILRKKDKEDLNPDYMSHYELSKIIASLLGYRISNFSTQRSEGYFVDGNLLNGLNGFNHIIFNDDGSFSDHFQ